MQAAQSRCRAVTPYSLSPLTYEAQLEEGRRSWSYSVLSLLMECSRVMCVSGTKVQLGDSVICESEVDVLIALGLEYEDPTERNCFDIKFIEEDEAIAKRNSNTNGAGAGSE
ncbi:hypothetical protein PInf_012903 [Phytophthora infestans]|nr:hypothetical protein PInf_012903 [Phytophthora infestans]